MRISECGLTEMRMSNTPLAGKTALVTGAAKRIGREIALTLADEGADIIVHYRSSEDEARELLQELEDRGVRSWLVQADFEKPDETDSLVERALAQAGWLDILVNSASIFPSDKLENLTFDGLMKNIQVNSWSPFVLMRSFAEKSGRGAIVNMLDSRVWGYDWTHVGYILSKHVLTAMTKMAALQYAPDITVNGIAPGLILPPPGKPESYIDALKDTIPLRRHGDPQDIADAVAYLVKSDFVTGEVIFVDGGRHLKEYLDPGKRP
jgi:pteridine reductase